MTVEVTTNIVRRPGDGSTFTFSGGTMEIFTAPDPSEIEVYVDDGSGNVTTYTEGTGASNFSVSFTDSTAVKSTFTLTLPADSSTALTANDTVHIKSVVPLTQTVDLSNQGPYLAEVQEQAFDRLVFIVQQLDENVDRTLRVNVTEQTFVDLELPNVDSATAGSTIILNSGKTGVEWGSLAGTLPDPVTVARGGTGATTAAAARTALGIAYDDAVTLQNKTIDLPFSINDTSDDHTYDLAVSELAADRTITLPLLTGNDQFTFDAHATTLTNKTIDSASNTLTVDLSEATVTMTLAELNAALSDHTLYGRTGQERIHSMGAKVGGTAGWTVGAADDLGLAATCPASQTASTLVLPISGLKVGDTITAFKVVAQIESGGNTVTLDANLRKLTTAAADVTDASVGSISQVSVTEDTAVAEEVTGLSEVVAADETFYVLLTATTAASTDIALQGVTVTVTEA